MTEDRSDNFGIYKLACQLFDDFWNDSEIVGKDYRRMKFLLPAETIQKRVAVLDQIIGGLITTINTIESKRTK